MILHLLDCRFSTVLVPCHKGKVDQVQDALQGIGEGNHLARDGVQKCHSENTNNHLPNSFHHLSTPLGNLPIWLVQSSKARIWRHHRPELVEPVEPAMLFGEDRYPVHQMLRHTDMEAKKDYGYDNTRQGDAFHIPEDSYIGHNHFIFPISSCFPSLQPMSPSH